MSGAEVGKLKIKAVSAPLRRQVIDGLRGAIADGTLKPGERLVERELCEMTGVSRTSIREALRQLEADGLVISIPNKGMVVASIDSEEARQIYSVRAVLEALAASEFAKSGSKSSKALLKEEFKSFSDAARENDQTAMIAAKERFYAILFEGANNPFLQGIISNLYARIMLLRSMSLSHPGRSADSVKEIKSVVDAIAKGDAAAAWEASLSHVNNAAETLQKAKLI